MPYQEDPAGALARARDPSMSVVDARANVLGDVRTESLSERDILLLILVQLQRIVTYLAVMADEENGDVHSEG